MERFAGIAAALAVVAACSSPAYAQPAGRFSVAGTVDYTRITDDESLLGSGIGAGGALGWRLTDATGVEIEVSRTRHVRDLGLFAVAHDAQGRLEPVPYTERWEGTATFVIASVAHTFGSGPVRPVVWGGGGFMTHGGTERGPKVAPQAPPGFTLQPGDGETRRGPGTNAAAVDGGLGVDIRVAPRVTLRPFAGLRLANTQNVGPKYLVRTGVRVEFR
ncbi:MAG TPA: hypothetical protein VFK57_10070 [Vicinamibacterales bacterium]|nr:hypothetical protein [Vicinamibacterales bacterium]